MSTFQTTEPVKPDGMAEESIPSIPLGLFPERSRAVATDRGRDRRRRILVNRSYQLRVALLTGALTLSLLVVLNFLVHTTRAEASRMILDAAPQLETMVRAQNGVEVGLSILVSAIFLVCVFLVTMLETHKTAGAAWQIRLRLGDIRDGRYETRVRLRQGDNLVEIETAFNEMCMALEDRTWRQVEALERLAASAGQVETPDDARRLSARLYDLAAYQSRRVSGARPARDDL